MKRSVPVWQLVGFIFTSVGGSILHFLYGWLGDSVWIAPFSGVNESTWEHMKLLFWSMFIFAVVQSFFFSDYKEFWCVKLRGILLGLALIPGIYYIYNGVIGKSPDWLNIAIFFISAAAAYVYELRLFNSGRLDCKSPKVNLAVLCVVAALFAVFTFAAPELELFRDPLTGAYGI